MGLVINQVRAQIGIERIPASFEVRRQRSQIQIRQHHASIKIETEPPKLLIDQYEAFASCNLKSTGDFIRDAANEAYQNVMSYIARIAQEGDTFAAIENGGNPIAEIAENNAFPEKEFGYDYIPKVGPRFSLLEGQVYMDPGESAFDPKHGVKCEYIPGRVDINFKPAQIRVYMKQYPSIKFSYITGSKVDYYL